MESSNDGLSRTKERCSTFTGNHNIEAKKNLRKKKISRDRKSKNAHQQPKPQQPTNNHQL
jgi:hypothetical protein